jgi:Cu/Ag efflux pump CusA
MTEGNGWDEYKRLVLHELERNNKRLHSIEKRLNRIDQHITEQRTKMIFGSSIISVVFAGLVSFVFKIFS